MLKTGARESARSTGQARTKAGGLRRLGKPANSNCDMKTKDLVADLMHIAEVSVGYSAKVKAKDRKKVTSASDAHELLHFWYEHTGFYEQREIMTALLMDRANKVLGLIKIGEGSATGCVVDEQYLLRAAILANAQGIIMAHNHPSGNLKPSEADIKLSNKLKKAGKFINIKVHDSIILSSDGEFRSLANEGELK
jgi:DNA repair protein RadC